MQRGFIAMAEAFRIVEDKVEDSENRRIDMN
jgi:hypothetical protein